MEQILKKWGNSIGIHIPISVLRAVGLQEGDRVEIAEKNGEIVVKRSTIRTHKTIAQRVMDIYGVDLDDVQKDIAEEVDFGSPVGEEIW